MKTRLVPVLMALLLSLPLAAQANLFNFSYTSSVGTLTGQLSGTLQADNDTVQVSSILSAALNGKLGPALPDTGTYTAFYNSGYSTFDGQGLVSLSGNTMDFIASDASGVDGFVFTPPGTFTSTEGYGALGWYGNLGATEPYNASNWSLTAVSPVPEPSEIALLGIGFVGLGISRRKKHRGR